jgi:predicted nuclease with TOPRIM domain
VDSAVDLAKHLREHANVFDPLPQAVSQPRPNSQPTSQSQATSQPDDIPAPPPVAEPLPSQKPTIEIEIDSADRASPSTVDQIKAASAANLSDLTAKLDTAQSRVQSLVEENAWIRRMYDSASNSAAEEARRNDDLKKEMKILRQQLKLGLRQKDLHGEAIRSQWTAENAKLRAQVKILLDQSRLTDDAIREKAIKYPRVHERNKKLEQDLRESRQRNETLKERNEELRDQVEVLRARQMGVFQPGPGDEDESEGEETDAEEDRDSEIEGAEDPGALGYDVRHPHVTAWGNVHVPTPSGSGELATGPHKGFTGIAKGLEVVGAEPEALIPQVHVEVKEEEVVDVPLIYCRAQLPSKEMCTRAFDTAEVSPIRPST